MKFLSFRNQLLGTLIENTVIDMNAAYQHFNIKGLPLTMYDLIKSDYNRVYKVWQTANEAKLNNVGCYNYNEITPLPPIPHPHRNIFCLGKNFQDHIVEMGNNTAEEKPNAIIVFSKSAGTVIGQHDPIPSHLDITHQLDYEGEVALIVGKRGRNISKKRAWDYIFGYTAINDVTARDLQKKHKQWFIGKNLDGFAPMGPVIVHRSSMPPLNKIEIKSYVNKELRQSATMDKLIFSVPEIINQLSQGITLWPGDIIATGTPAGVGAGFEPPRFLKPGDVVSVEVSEVGSLVNEVD